MSSSYKLIFICQVFYPDKTSTSQLFTPLIQSLRKQGIEVLVICGFPVKGDSSKVLRKEEFNGVTIKRCGLRLPLKRNFILRSVAYLTFLFETLFNLLCSPNEARWLGVTNPPFLAWILAFSAVVKRRSYCFFFHDLHPEGLVALGSLSRSVWYVKTWKAINRWSYRYANHLLVLGRDMIPLLSKEYGLNSEKLIYLPHWSASELRSPVAFSESKFTRYLKLKDKFVVQYSGNMGLWHDIESFVFAAKQLEEERHIQFVFIGGGLRRNQAELLALELECMNIQWHDFVELKDLPESLAACHISLISLRAGLEGVAVPCKLYGILAAGRAVVAQVPADSEVSLAVNEHKCGVVVHPGDLDELVNVLKRLSDNPNEVDSMGCNAFAAYEQYYRIENAVQSLKSELNL